MTARPHAQMLIISTMGTHDSTVWNSLVARGRLEADNPDATTAYLEYSAPSDEAVYDPSQWAQWMPALHRTVLPASIQSALDDIPDEFERIRAYGNRLTASASGVWPVEHITRAWRIVDAPEHFVLAVDVNQDPLGAAITTGHITGTEDNPITATRVVHARQGVGPRWIPSVVRQMVTHRKVEAIVGDFGGPARQIHAELEAIAEETGVPLLDRRPVDVASDTLRFTEALRDGRAAMQRDVAPLIEAVSAARIRRQKDLWWVARQLMLADASPLISTILAHGLAEELDVRPRVKVTVHW